MDEVTEKQNMILVRHIFVIGAKSIGQYGGYETFVDKLTEQHQDNSSIKYHIACKANGDGYMDETKLLGVKVTKKNIDGSVAEFTYHNAHVFKISCPNIGSAVAIYYDSAAFKYSIQYCKDNHIKNPIFYILTCRIGVFINGFKKQLEAMGGIYYLNPDGHEWKRAKWSKLVRAYWKWSEKKMVNAADMVICDSVNIEKYIKKEYGHPRTLYIAYGADIMPSVLADDDLSFCAWLKEKGIGIGKYYLVVGRFVPENNYEIMIREFMKSESKRNFVIISNMNNKLKMSLEKNLHFSADPRIKFVGTVYDRELLKKIRENAYAYVHGHEVGGTNPSLLEALGSTDLNLLLGVDFNKEVGQDAALYWSKETGDLVSLIDRVDSMDLRVRERFGRAAKERIKTFYNWKFIGNEYKKVWNDNQNCLL